MRRNLPPHLCQRQFFEPFMHVATRSHAENVAKCQQEASGELSGTTKWLSESFAFKLHARVPSERYEKFNLESHWGLCSRKRVQYAKRMHVRYSSITCGNFSITRSAVEGSWLTRWRLLRLHAPGRKKGNAAVKIAWTRCKCLQLMMILNANTFQFIGPTINYNLSQTNCVFMDRKQATCGWNTWC